MLHFVVNALGSLLALKLYELGNRPFAETVIVEVGLFARSKVNDVLLIFSEAEPILIIENFCAAVVL